MTRVAYLSGAPRVSTDDGSPNGGPRAHVVGVIRALERSGAHVDRYIAGDQRWARRVAGGERDAAVRKARWRAYAADAVRLASGAGGRAAAPRALAGRYDLAYERFGSFNALGRGFQRRGSTWVLETQGPYFHEAKAERGTLALTGLARRSELAAYDACDVLVCVSEALRSWLVDAGVRGDHTYVMPNAVDVARFDPARWPRPERPPHLVVGFVGTVLAWQGLDVLVRAVALARGRGVEVEATVVGEGPALADLRRLAAELGVASTVTFPGQVPASEVPARIAAFDLGVSAHVPLLDGRMYHSPLKLYEYLAMGVPLLAADHPEARRLVEGSGAGLLVPPGDVEALAAALAVAAGDLAALRAAGPSVRAHAVAAHSWDRRVADLLVELRRRGA